MFKKLLIAIAMGIGLMSGAANAALISSTVGDADCFGLGGACADGDLWSDGLGGVFFTDYQTVGDPSHTDSWFVGDRAWEHLYSLGGEAPVAAFLDLLIAGFADIGSVDLLAGATVIATYDFADQFQSVHALTVAVPLGLIDGATSFSLSGPGDDGYIIDYSTLRITTEGTVPEPAPIALIGIGLAGLLCSRRRTKV